MKANKGKNLVKHLLELSEDFIDAAHLQNAMVRLVDETKPMPQGVKEKVFANHPVPTRYMAKINQIHNRLDEFEGIYGTAVSTKDDSITDADDENSVMLGDYLNEAFNDPENESNFLDSFLTLKASFDEIVKAETEDDEELVMEMSPHDLGKLIRLAVDVATTDYKMVDDMSRGTGLLLEMAEAINPGAIMVDNIVTTAVYNTTAVIEE